MAQATKLWQLATSNSTHALPHHIPEALARVLSSRLIDTRAKLQALLEPPQTLPYNPLRLTDMDLALQRLYETVNRGEKVGIFGDFDVDGITGTAIIAEGLEGMGVPVEPYLPHRVGEGHGLSNDAIKHLSANGSTLIITVDCGVTSAAEVSYARNMGIDVIITDHHTPPVNPPEATAIINPRMRGNEYPFLDLCGAGLAFKLVQGLYQYHGQLWNRNLLELAALGTIADLVPLVDENRYLVQQGLVELAKTKRPGLKALYQRAGVNREGINTETASFQITPRLNSPGRMSHAIDSYKLLTTTSDDEAEDLAERLETLNQDRRNLTERAFSVALDKMPAQDRLPSIVVMEDGSFTPGISGLIAGRLSEMYHRPAVVMADIGDGYVTASGRSIPEFNLVEAFTACEPMFLRYGGHSQAAGFTLLRDKIPELTDKLGTIAEEMLESVELRPILGIDAEVNLSEITEDFLLWLAALEPFGVANRQPVFLTRNVGITDTRYMGNLGQHLRLRVRQGNVAWTAVAFNQADKWSDGMEAVDIVYTLSSDYWRGEKRVNLKLLDFRPAEN